MPVLRVVREAEVLSSSPDVRLAASITINIIQAMKDKESDLHRLGEDVVTYITFIYQACKKLEGTEGQPDVQFHNVLDTFVKILESIELFVRRHVERNTFHRVMNSTADGTKIQEYRTRLAQIMRHFELELHLQLHELLQSIKAIVVADSTVDAAPRNGDHDLDHRPDAFEDGNGMNCQKCASSKSPGKKAESSTRRLNHERAVPLINSRKPKVESESEIYVGETTEEERTWRAAKRAGKEKANRARTENIEDMPYSQPSTSNNNPFALHALPMPNFFPYCPPPYHPWLYQPQAMWMIPTPLFLGASMPSINTYWTSNINSHNFTKTAMNNLGNDHSKHRTN